jgi:hypothetical protein
MRRCCPLLLLAACLPEAGQPDWPEPTDLSYAQGDVWRVVPERCGQDTGRVALTEYGIVTFVNRYGSPVEVVLVDDLCLEYPAVELGPGEQAEVGAYIGWVFRVYEQDVLLSSWYMPMPGGGTVVVRP